MLEAAFDGPLGWLERLVAARDADAQVEAAELLAPQPGERLLVIGFGSGLGLKVLGEANADLAIVGVDPSAAMARAASARNKALISAGKLRLQTETLDSLARRGAYDGAFDGAIAVHSLHRCLPMAALATSLSRVLRPGGRFVTLTHGHAIERRFGSVRQFMDLAGPAFVEAGFGKLRGGHGRADKRRVVVFRGRKLES